MCSWPPAKGRVEISYLQNLDPYDQLRDLERRGYPRYRQYHAVKPAVIDQLQEYFAHERTGFNLPLDLSWRDRFHPRRAESNCKIPYGVGQDLWGYRRAAIGKPTASRAVGNALGRNPIPVIIPCHRVVLSSGAMGWYTGGPEIKRTLLGIEGVRYGATRLETSATLPLGL